MTLDRLQAQLDRFVRAHYGAEAEARRLRVMEAGHAGLTFGFEVWQGARCLDRLILKLAPKGVRRKGNTDVYRQAPLLRALHAQGLPVPPIRWASEDESWFEVPFVMMEFMPGEIFLAWDPDPKFGRTVAEAGVYWRIAAAALPPIHLFDWRRHLPDWEAPRPLAEEIRYWEPIMAQSPEPEWIRLGEAVRDLLLATMPEAEPIGLVHGDYQPSNLLFEDRRLVAILDWELACIGSQLLDIGWLLMTADPGHWHPDWGPVGAPPVAELRALYEQGMGREFPQIPWFQALAGFRLGAISCLNVKLHRKGQRVDPVWEKFALAVPNLFGHARAILEDYGRR